MKYLKNLLFSSVTTILLLLILMVAMGVATFIEDKFDTLTAQYYVYHARWFEALFLLLTVNMIGQIIKFRMISRKRWVSLLFHLSFIVILLGAAITRYFGFEGSMHIREGEETNLIYSQVPYFQIAIPDKEREFAYAQPFAVSPYTRNSLQLEHQTSVGRKIRIDYQALLPNAVEKIRENVTGGRKIVSLIIADEQSQQNYFLSDGEGAGRGMLTIVFNNTADSGAIQVSDNNGRLFLTAPFELLRIRMADKVTDTIKPLNPIEFSNEYIFQANGQAFVNAGFYPNATTEFVAGNAGEKGTDAVIMTVTIDNTPYKATVFGGAGYIMRMQEFTFGNQILRMGYGEKPIELPFSLKLNDFVLDRYAGSMSPSSYASEITLIDPRKNLRENHRIFMNNVLDYNMYRFFQSSYDSDEKGTILSVNHDFFGTVITYIGYFLLILGFVLTLFDKNSRFRDLGHKIREVRILRKSSAIAVFVILTGFGTTVTAQQNPSRAVSADQAEKFGRLLIQSYDGRFQPVHSLAYDVMHKISRKDKFSIPGKGELDAVQVMMDMVMDPVFWREQKIIYVREKPVQEMIGIQGKYASFHDFFDENHQYKLQKSIEEAFRKKQSTQNSLDKELIKVDERLNIFEMATKGSMFTLFPLQGSTNNKWIAWDDKAATLPMTGQMEFIGQELQISPLNYQSLLSAYFQAVNKGIATGDYSGAEKIAARITDIQRNSSSSELLASETKVNLEILYNKLQIFIVLRNVYAILSIALLLLAFIDNLRPKKNRLISGALNISIAILGLAFLYHTFGMALRWYLTGHAPWSNGYESLILIAWGGLLAGFSFARYSKITTAATALLAFFILMTASHSSYDPQLTNLQPVLKSYWLIIHVATLTISYGFLGLGFILGLMNLVMYLFKTVKNSTRLDLIIAELTYINEMNLIVGIVLATIGTFLGGIWANESLGRYWGWDAKETWALVIVIAYTLILHLRFIPKMRSHYVFNVASVAGFGSVIMTFVGVNYYLSKGMHSYGAGETPVFPLWAWGIILSIITLMVVSGIRQQFIAKNTHRAK